MPFPPQFIASLANIPNFDEQSFQTIHQSPSPTSIRLNPFKTNNTFDNLPNVPWCEHGRYLSERPNFTLDPLFHAGTYYVQEASSMFLAHALHHLIDLAQPQRVLDLCAAPGGKSTLMASMLSSDSVLVANEIIKNRAGILANNLSKWGTANTYVSNNDPKDFGRLEGYFDVLVVDAPCSGSGLFRKDPQAMNEWSLEAVKSCSIRQKKLLGDAWEALREDGILIYSTCSYSSAENEEISDCIMNTLGASYLKLPTFEGIDEGKGYRFWPDKCQGEGFYMACFRKTETTELFNYRYQKTEPNKLRRTQTAAFEHWVQNLEDYIWVQKNDDFFLLNQEQKPDFELFSRNLYLRKAGVRLGQMAGLDLIPDHELAMSIVLKKDVPSLDLDKSEALKYLRRDDFVLPSHWQAPHKAPTKNWSIVRYQGHALGLVKVLPNRINNYYPKDMRILMGLG